MPPTQRRLKKSSARRGQQSRLIFQLSYPLEAALKAEAAAQGKQWQTLLRELLMDALGVEDLPESSGVKMRPATDLHHAMRVLKTK